MRDEVSGAAASVRSRESGTNPRRAPHLHLPPGDASNFANTKNKYFLWGNTPVLMLLACVLPSLVGVTRADGSCNGTLLPNWSAGSSLVAEIPESSLDGCCAACTTNARSVVHGASRSLAAPARLPNTPTPTAAAWFSCSMRATASCRPTPPPGTSRIAGPRVSSGPLHRPQPRRRLRRRRRRTHRTRPPIL